MTVRDWQAAQNFELKTDPRWTAIKTEDDQAQLEPGLEIRYLITESHQRIKNLRSVREQMAVTAKLAVKAGHAKELESRAKAIGEN